MAPLAVQPLPLHMEHNFFNFKGVSKERNYGLVPRLGASTHSCVALARSYPDNCKWPHDNVGENNTHILTNKRSSFFANPLFARIIVILGYICTPNVHEIAFSIIKMISLEELFAQIHRS